jgi:hypothetical protein
MASSKYQAVFRIRIRFRPASRIHMRQNSAPWGKFGGVPPPPPPGNKCFVVKGKNKKWKNAKKKSSFLDPH